MAAADYYPIVQELYMSYFGRPADPRGLENFAAKLDALGAPTDPTEMVAALVSPAGQNTDLKAFINSSFSTSDESKALYTSNDNLLFVNQIYKNVLNRDGDRDGLLYWTNKLDNHEVSRENAALAILEGALNNTTPQGLEDAKLVAVKVEIAQHFTDAIDTGPELTAYVGNAAAAAARNMLQTVTSSTTAAAFQTTVEATLTGLVEGSNAGQSFDLKTGVDTLNGTNGNDTFNAVLGTVTTTTLTGLDNINGGLGSNDVLNIADTAGNAKMPSGITLTSIETVNLSSVGAIGTGAGAGSFDISGHTSVTALNIATSTGADFVKAGSGQAVTVNDLGGKVTIVGGSTQTVTTAGGVALSKAAGAINVTDSAQNTANTTIDNGTDVNLNSTSDLDGIGLSAGSITIGGTTAASGNVTVTTTVAGDVAAGGTAGDIEIHGGKVITVTQNSTQGLDSDGSAAVLNQSFVDIYGNGSTTTVNVKQAMVAAAEDAVDAVAEVAEVGTVKFSALKANESVTVDGLTFTATKALTAAQAAAAFANLVKGATQGTAPTANGLYTGTYGGNWASGAAASDTVTFTNTAGGALGAGTHLSDVVSATGTATATATTTTTGVDEVEGVEGTGGITAGIVHVEDKNYAGTSANTIATVSLDSYGASSYVKSSALTSLSIANAENSSLAVWNKTATTLSLTVNDVYSAGVGGTSTLNLDAGGATYTSLNVHTAGDDSDVNVTAAAVTALKVDGEAAIDLSGSTFTALKTVAISGAAGVTADFSGSTVTDVNASATSGAVTATINASKATYEGGSGVDTVTTAVGTAVSKAISLGAGNDTINLAAGTTSLGAKIDGGEGTDTLGMAAADAAAASGTNVFAGNFTSFEKLKLGQSNAANTVNLANLNNISYVISANTVASGLAAATPLVPVTTQGNTVGPVTESSDIAFFALSAGQSYTVAGRTVTATGAATAAQVAAAMSSGANAANLTVTGVLTGWTAAAPSGAGTDHVVFTSTTAGQNVTDIAASASAGGTSVLTLSNMADAGTLELNAAGDGVVVSMKDATGTADTFNIVTKGNASANYGVVSVAGVENVNVNVNDTKASDGIMTATLAVKDAAAKTLTITGNANLTLQLEQTTGTTWADNALTKIDGSAATGKLVIGTVSTATAAATLLGGSAADTLTANHISDTLNGGAGNDTLIINADLVSLTGGAGKDVFNVAHATSNVNAYATITDLGSGDMIKFAASAATFNASKVALGDTAVFQDFANAAINQSDTGNITWFQFGGATYVVENVSNNPSAFVNGTDIIVKITGLVDLSTASFNSDKDTLLIA